MDTLYYEDGSPWPLGVSNASEGIRFSPDVLATFLRKVYNGFDTDTDIEPTAWREALRLINEATVEGLGRADVPPTHEEEFYSELRHSNEVFAAFKVHSMGEKMSAKLTTADGKLKPFRQWAEEVKGISGHYVGSWLRTEYDTAVIRAHAAADWKRFERDKDVMPNLRWMPTTSPEPDSAHRVYWQKKLTLPVDHPFWQRHRPGDRWNCKCTLEQTDEPANPEVLDGIEDTPPQQGLENNPGRDGHTFNDTHPYFPKSCEACSFYKPSLKNRLATLFRNRKKDCYNCPYIDGCLENNKEKALQKESVEKERKRILSSNDVPTSTELRPLQNIKTGDLLLSKKPLTRLLNHCRSMEEIDAALYVWRKPQILEYVRESPLGEGKKLSSEKASKNIQKKRERGIVAYHEYSFKYRDTIWIVKLEEHKKGFEQPYFIREK